MRPMLKPSPRLREAAIIVVALAAALGLTGCYEHVVSAKGYDTSGVSIHEPNLREDWDETTDSERRAKRRRDLNELHRSVPKAPRAY
jgi:hypothetical protein